MDKSATGTEYVNAQAEDLRMEIDKLAGEIQGTTIGLVYEELFQGQFAYAQVVLVTDIYRDRLRCRLKVCGAQWNGTASELDKTVTYYGSLTVTRDQAIPEALRPPEAIADNASIIWRGGHSGGGTVSINVSTGGRIQIAVEGSGYFNRSFEYLL